MVQGQSAASSVSLPVFLARLLLVAVGYAIAGRVGMMVASVADYVTLLWLPAGVAVAALLRWGMGMWVGVALGAFGLELFMGSSLHFAAGVTVGKTLGPMAAAWWLVFMGLRQRLDRREDLVLFMIATALAMAIPPTGGVICLAAEGIIAGWRGISYTWLTWWLGDIVGVIVMAPVLLKAGNGCCVRVFERPGEFVVWLAMSSVATVGLLMTPEGLPALIGLLFLPLPLLVWAGMRFGGAICALWVLAITLISIFLTNAEFGPFYEYGVPEGLMMLWAYLGALATVGLVVTALQAEQLAAEVHLKRSWDLQELLIKLATGFVNIHASKLDTAINEALAEVGQLTEADRAYVFRYDLAAHTMSNTYEWCAPGVNPVIANTQQLDIDVFPDIIEEHRRGETVHVENVAQLPTDSPLRHLLERQGIRTLITLPMHIGEDLVGFVGFDDVRNVRVWGQQERNLLHVLAQMFANAEARRQFETKYRESEKRLRAIGNNLPDGAVYRMMQYPAGRIEIPYISEGISRILGFTAKEVMANPELITQSIHEDDLESYRSAAEETIKSLTPFDFEIRHRLKNGEIKWLHIRSAPTRIEGGAVMADGVAMDITRQKQAFDALRQSEILLRSVGNNLPNAALFQVERSPQGKVRMTYVSQGIERILETPVEDFLEGRAYISTLLPPDERERYVAAAINAVEDMKVLDGVYRRTRLNGDTQWVEIRAFNRTLPSGTIMSEGVISDVTSRKRVEEALRANETSLRSYIEHAPMGVLVIDRKGHYVDANVVAQLMFQRSLEQLRGNTIWDFIPEESRATSRDLFERMVEGEYVKGELILCRYDGSHFWVRSHAVALSDDRYLSYIEDITAEREIQQARDRMEAELRQAQKMEAVGRLAGGVAHDFNNMLQVILSHVDILLMETDTASDLHEDLDEIRRAAQRSTELVRQLLAFSRKQVIMPRVVDLNELIHERSAMLSRLIGPHIEVNFTPGTDLWSVRIDGSQVDQILTNLVVNARDAINRRGTITITTENRTVDAEAAAKRNGMRPDSYVRLAVRDTGEGMDEETLARVFEPFFTTKKQGEGTGLGLATVYGIVKQNDGYIDVISELGEGTEIEIFLPRHSGEPTADAGHETRGRLEPGKETVLIAEDEESILNAARRILGSRGYTVLTANNAREALYRADEHPGTIHMLLTDVIMPDMNGRELRTSIDEIRPGIKTLYMSGYSADVIMAGGELEPSMFFIQKPFTSEQLARKVREVLDA